ncbi:hypothetical protein KP509_1Z047300 [Ceratopteris richardii]|nr:hypothetical protein KP509_1Z047300 [Ceratopteris richardii]
MPSFICCNCSTDLCKLVVTKLFRLPCSIPMRNESCSLLKGSVDEPQIGAILCLWIHSRSNKVLYSLFNDSHIYSPCEVEVFV